MAATMKLSLTFIVLLSSGLVVVFGDAGDSGSGATCETIRCIQGGNITCVNHEEVIGCHCLCAPKNGKGCVLRRNDGTTENCPTKKNC